MFINIVVLIVLFICNYPFFFPKKLVHGGGSTYFDRFYIRCRFLYIHKAIKLYFYQYLVKKKILDNNLYKALELAISILIFKVLCKEYWVRFVIDQTISTLLIETYLFWCSKYYLKFNEYHLYLLIMFPYSCIC